MNKLLGPVGQTTGCFLVIMLAQSWVLAPALAATDRETDGKSPMRGRVETSGARRVSRPDAPLQGAATEMGAGGNAGQSAGDALAGQIDSRNFTLGTDERALKAALNTDIMGGVNNAYDPPSLLGRSFLDQTPAQQAAAIDYAAIERVYAQAVPPVGSSESPLQSALIAIRASLNGVVGPTGMPLGATHIDVDNCDCGTPVPSHQCMGERTSVIYGGSYSVMRGGFGGRVGGHR
jgi:hypothetical protein